MKYLLLLTNPVDEIAHWETLSAEETGRLREAEIPQWNELFAHMAENGVQSSGLELELPVSGLVDELGIVLEDVVGAA